MQAFYSRPENKQGKKEPLWEHLIKTKKLASKFAGAFGEELAGEWLGTFHDDWDNERLIRTAKQTYSFENTMYGTLGPERTVWNEEANEAMKAAEAKQNKDSKKKK